MAAVSAFVATPTAAPFLPPRNPNPNPRFSVSARLLTSRIRFQPRPGMSASYSPLLRFRNPNPSLRTPQVRSRALRISAVSVPSIPFSSLIATVRSIPAQLTAVAARAAPTAERLAAIGAIFAAAASNRPPSGLFESPLQALASGAGSWLGLYAEILSVRCLLTWFPNVPWERQPFSALRDLCDPFLFLCRKLCPPIKGMDVSPLIAFWVIGLLVSLLSRRPPGM